MATKNWMPITEEISRTVLVTNNLKARDAKGNMSHVWVVTIIIESSEPDKYGKFTAFDEADRRLMDLTHYCEIPL